MSTNKIH